MKNDPITDAIKYAEEHPFVTAGVAYVLGTKQSSMMMRGCCE